MNPLLVCVKLVYFTCAFTMFDVSGPLLVMNGTPLYMAVPAASVTRSGAMRSKIFFFGFKTSSGVPAQHPPGTA